MAIPDADIYPHATGEALKTAGEHEATQDLTFYSAWFCPFVHRVWMALEEKGIPYQYKEENPYKKDPEYLKISPKGLVPAVVADGKPINESLVILEYLEDAYPNTRPLLPKDPVLRAHVRLAIDHISKTIVPGFFKLMQTQDKEGQEKVRIALEDAFVNFAERVKGPYLAGDQLTTADLALAPFIGRLYLLEEHRNFNVHKTNQKLKVWIEEIEKVPAYHKTLSDKVRYEQLYHRYLSDVAQSEAARAIRSGGVFP